MTLRLGDGSLVVTDTQSYSDKPSTAYLDRGVREKWRKNRSEEIRRGNKLLHSCYYGGFL